MVACLALPDNVLGFLDETGLRTVWDKTSFPPGAWPGRYGEAGADDAIRCGIRVTKTRFLLVSGSLTITGVGANGRILERAGLRSNSSHSGQDFLVPETRWRDIGWLPVLWPSELLDPQRLRSPVSGGWISRHKKNGKEMAGVSRKSWSSRTPRSFSKSAPRIAKPN